MPISPEEVQQRLRQRAPAAPVTPDAVEARLRARAPTTPDDLLRRIGANPGQIAPAAEEQEIKAASPAHRAGGFDPIGEAHERASAMLDEANRTRAEYPGLKPFERRDLDRPKPLADGTQDPSEVERWLTQMDEREKEREAHYQKHKVAAHASRFAGAARRGLLPGVDLDDPAAADIEARSRRDTGLAGEVAEALVEGAGAAATLGAVPGPGILKMAGYGAAADRENPLRGAAHMTALGIGGGALGRAAEAGLSRLPPAVRVPLAHATAFPTAGTVLRAATGEETDAATLGTEIGLGLGGGIGGVKRAARGDLRAKAGERRARQAEQDVETAKMTQESAALRGETDTWDAAAKGATTGQPFDAILYRNEAGGRSNPDTGDFLGPRDVAGDMRAEVGPEGVVRRRRVQFGNPLVVKSKWAWLNEQAEAGDAKARAMLGDPHPMLGGARDIKPGAYGMTERYMAEKAREAGHDGIVNLADREVQDLRGGRRPASENSIRVRVDGRELSRAEIDRLAEPKPELVGAVEERGSLAALKAPVDWVMEMGRSAVSGIRSLANRAGRGGAEGKGKAEAADVRRRLLLAADETRAAEGYAADAFRAEQETGGLTWMAARARLQTPERVPGKDYGVAPITEILEGRQAPRNANEAEIVKRRQGLVSRLGEIEVTDRVMVPDRPVAHGGSGKMVLFTNPSGVEPRNPMPLLAEILRNKNHPERPKAVEAYADLNKMPKAEVEAIFDEMALDYGESGGGAKERTTQSEHRRYFERVPTHLWIKNQPQPLYEIRAGHYGRAFLHGRAARVGFRRAFGQDFALTPTGHLLRGPGGKPVSPHEQMGERYGAETGRPDVFHESVRAAAGRTVEPEPVTSTKGRALAHVGKGALALYKTGKLSATALYNLLEPLVRIPESGVLNTARAYIEGVGAGLQRLSRGALGKGLIEKFRALERQGAIDVSRRTSTHGGVQGIGARAMQLRAESMQARAATPDRIGASIDAARLRAMGYDQPTAKRLSEGGGTGVEYRDLVNRTVPRTTGQRITGQEQMRAEHMRTTKVLFPIMRFMARQAAIIGNSGKAWGQALVRAGKNPGSGEAWRDAVSSSKQLFETVGLHGAVGAGQVMVYSLAYGGGPALAATIARFADDPEKAFTQGFLANAVGGPLGAMMAAMRGDRSLASGIFPVALGMELGDLTSGEGKYRDAPWSERAGIFVKGAIPAIRVADTAMTGIVTMFAGKPDREQEWREAIKAYRGWARDDKVPDARFFRLNPTDTDERFATAMRKAYRAMLQNRSPDVVETLLTEGLSVEGKGGRNLKSALEARMILADGEVQKRLPALKARIGERAFANLEAHDALLSGLIDAVEQRTARKRDGGQVGREKPQPPVDREATRKALETAAK